MRSKHTRAADFKLYGIFGKPLSHTLSPAMQEAAFQALGLKAYYLALELGPVSFRKVMRGRKRLTLDGFNITVPYKGTVLPYLDTLTPEARAIGAVNTVFCRGRRWTGANTDVSGFLASLHKEGRFAPRGRNVLILGAGGSARAAAYGLAKKGAREIWIANRHKTRAKTIIRDFRRIFPRTRFESLTLHGRNGVKVLERVSLVINATSVGLKRSDPSLIPAGWIPRAAGGRRKLFFDFIYRPAKTRFLKSAAQRRHKTMNGLGMLLHQGARAFELWTGKKAPVAAMRKALMKRLGDES